LSADSLERLPHNPLFERRFTLAISFYLQVAANEVAIDGFIGSHHMTGLSTTRFQRTRVTTDLDGHHSYLSFARKLRPGLAVSGEIMGQPVSGRASVRRGLVQLVGFAGQEPLQYQIQTGGAVTCRGGDLGVRVTQQALFTEVTGSVDRIADALVAVCLVPLSLRGHEPDSI